MTERSSASHIVVTGSKADGYGYMIQVSPPGRPVRRAWHPPAWKTREEAQKAAEKALKKKPGS